MGLFCPTCGGFNCVHIRSDLISEYNKSEEDMMRRMTDTDRMIWEEEPEYSPIRNAIAKKYKNRNSDNRNR